jgi:hypothetical protein
MTRADYYFMAGFFVGGIAGILAHGYFTNTLFAS